MSEPDPLQNPEPQVWLVDDDPIVRRVMQATLRKFGIESRCWEDPRAAWSHIEDGENQLPQIVITDWNMPQMSGVDLTRRLRTTFGDSVYVVMVTSRDDEEDVLEAIEAGANDFLSKPIDRPELVARVKQGQQAIAKMSQQNRLSTRDTLTNSLNRRSFDEHCEAMISSAYEKGEPLSCALIDIDYFKHINDCHGHVVGDEALKLVAECLQSGVREADGVYRYGGDEFCLLLPGTDESQATGLVERIRCLVSGLTVEGNGETISLQITAGVAGLRDDVMNARQFTDLTDQALLVAKKAGRNRVLSINELDEFLIGEHSDADNLSEWCVQTKAGSLMISPPVTVGADMLVRDVAELFLQLRIDSAPVVDTEGRLAGTVSEQDIFNHALVASKWGEPIRRVMQTNTVCFDRDDTVERVWDFLRRVTVRRVVIVDNDRPVGTISRATLLRWAGHRVALARGADSRRGDDKLVDRVAEITGDIRKEIQRLAEFVRIERHDVTPVLVCAATRLQEHSEELLARSQTRPRAGRISTASSQFLAEAGVID